jgi:hypothetical protein
VRETERRAKGEGGSSPRAVPHPDELEALREAEEELESALGTGVRVKAARKGFRAEIEFEDMDQLRAFARDRKR